MPGDGLTAAGHRNFLWHLVYRIPDASRYRIAHEGGRAAVQTGNIDWRRRRHFSDTTYNQFCIRSQLEIFCIQ